MPIVTLCRSCGTISRAINDRCKYCGSTRTEVKSVAPELIQHTGLREFVKGDKKVRDGSRKAHS